jgi:hypothetical protein
MRLRGQRDAEEENRIQWAEERTVGVARKPDGSPEADECFAPQPRKGDGGDDERPHALHAPAQPYHGQRYGKELDCQRGSPQHRTPRQRLIPPHGKQRLHDAPQELIRGKDAEQEQEPEWERPLPRCWRQLLFPFRFVLRNLIDRCMDTGDVQRLTKRRGELLDEDFGAVGVECDGSLDLEETLADDVGW